MQPLWMLAASFLFALMAMIVKLTAADVGAFALVGWRGAVGLALIASWVLLSGRSLKTNYLGGHIKRSLIGTISMCMWFYAVARLPLATGTTLNYTSPLFMSAIAIGFALARRKPIEWALVIATIAGFGGVLLVLRPDTAHADVVASLVGLCSGLGSALAYFQIRELTLTGEPEWRIVFYFLIANLVLGVAGHLIVEPSSHYSSASLAGALAVGLTATAAQICMTKSFNGGNPILSSLFTYSGIIFGAVFGALVFAERLDLLSYLGIAVIIAAGVTAAWMNKCPKKAKADKAR